MSDQYLGSKRGTFTTGPAVAYKEFTPPTGDPVIMPQFSISLQQDSGYTEVDAAYPFPVYLPDNNSTFGIYVTPVASSTFNVNVTNSSISPINIRPNTKPLNSLSFVKNHTPSSNTQATITQTAAGSAIKNVCTSISASFASTNTTPTAKQVYLYLRDGGSGSGDILWSMALAIPAVAGQVVGVAQSDLWIQGTNNTAMTLEFSEAGGANTVQTVTLIGIKE